MSPKIDKGAKGPERSISDVAFEDMVYATICGYECIEHGSKPNGQDSPCFEMKKYDNTRGKYAIKLIDLDASTRSVIPQRNPLDQKMIDIFFPKYDKLNGAIQHLFQKFEQRLRDRHANNLLSNLRERNEGLIRLIAKYAPNTTYRSSDHNDQTTVKEVAYTQVLDKYLWLLDSHLKHNYTASHSAKIKNYQATLHQDAQNKQYADNLEQESVHNQYQKSKQHARNPIVELLERDLQPPTKAK